MTKNPIYIGTNSAGTYKYIGQWLMTGLAPDKGEIKSITLYIYRNSNNSSYARDYYVGCSIDQTDYASVLSTGEMVSMSAGEGWKSLDITGLKDYIANYTSDWYLLIGNPNTKGTYAEIAGYGTSYMPYLIVEYADGSTIYLATGDGLVQHQLYRAENGTLVRYDLYHAENGSLVRY